MKLSEHAITNIEIIGKFLGVKITATSKSEEIFSITSVWVKVVHHGHEILQLIRYD